MEEKQKGVVVQVVLPIVDTKEEIDKMTAEAFIDIRQTLYDVLETRKNGGVIPAVIVRDFRVGGEPEHYV